MYAILERLSSQQAEVIESIYELLNDGGVMQEAVNISKHVKCKN